VIGDGLAGRSRRERAEWPDPVPPRFGSSHVRPPDEPGVIGREPDCTDRSADARPIVPSIDNGGDERRTCGRRTADAGPTTPDGFGCEPRFRCRIPHLHDHFHCGSSGFLPRSAVPNYCVRAPRARDPRTATSTSRNAGTQSRLLRPTSGSVTAEPTTDRTRGPRDRGPEVADAHTQPARETPNPHRTQAHMTRPHPSR
jgi:hypothetical protein